MREHDGAMDETDAIASPSTNTTFAEVVAQRVGRRSALRGFAAFAVASGLAGRANAQARSTLGFTELAHGLDGNHHVAPGYAAQVLIRRGDPVVKGAPPFKAGDISAADQETQFGENCDYIGYLPLPPGSTSSTRGLLAINHEFAVPFMMWPGLTRRDFRDKATLERVQAEIAAHGMSVIEVAKEGNRWRVVDNSTYGRRLTAATPMQMAGPAAGHTRLKTSYDPTGMRPLGTLNNCAGGRTPWGTVLTGEENWNFYFGSALPADHRESAAQKRYEVGTGRSPYGYWGKFVDRFDVVKEPNESNRFGWIVEIDPYDPGSTPIKRTALGRMSHEGANVVVNRDGRVVAYTGDDARFEYVYRFVSNGRFNPADRAANMRLLDDGVLSVARFDADGSLRWLPLVHGQGPLTAANGFADQGDVLIEARRAADLLGATRMDRPEDIDINPVTGAVFVPLTNNDRRKPEQKDAANPRGGNLYGHILAMVPPGGRGKDADHAADTFRWEIPIRAGDPRKPENDAKYGGAVSDNGWFICPDNLAFDNKGRMWISTDGGSLPSKIGVADGMWACDTEGPAAFITRHFYRVPTGGEMCGPEFTPDGTTLFVAIQHPAYDGLPNSTYDQPATRWPDFRDDLPPRSSVVAITKDDGGEIGS
jgi:secreted PhoX family phosphatase